MQRLATLTTRPLAGAPLACFSTSAVRLDGYTNKQAAKIITKGENAGWLEAEIDHNIIAPEERYAHQKEMERMRLMIEKLQKSQDDHFERQIRERSEEVAHLKQQMAEIHKKLKDLDEE
ncbi:hypothetical protein STCU_02322 [Strigomonas culicis]|uniref:Uncharacterized protein n=1 Tax=Strigomonas culicis TaxID=28005 RepID=S9W1E5_9TRYP|nr:hypothetical protein STCU_02322 [Strigomonas culicis]|eukprot:EPY33306.1 hypothetical protein STCU_02322 [Strigomonas culicis]